MHRLALVVERHHAVLLATDGDGLRALEQGTGSLVQRLIKPPTLFPPQQAGNALGDSDCGLQRGYRQQARDE